MATGDNKASFSRGSDEYYSLVCLPCHRDEATIPAFGYCIDCQEHLCRNCYNYHKKATPSRHHKLQDKDAMPSIQQLTDTAMYHVSTDNLKTPCHRHKNEIIKLFCHDHGILLCSICVAVEHRPCHVEYIPDISKKMINSSDYKHIMDRIDKLLKKCTTIQQETSRDSSKSKDSLTNALREMKKYRQDINKRLDELQKQIEDKIKDLQHKNDEQTKTIETVCEDVMKLVKSTQDNMKQLNSSKQADQLFIEVKEAQKQLQEYEQSVTSLSTEHRLDEYKFLPSQAINDVLQKEIMLGDLSTKPGKSADYSSQVTVLPPSADRTITPTSLTEICVKSSQDKTRCCITGMTVLPSERLVLADYRNNSIKLVDVNSKSILSHLSLGTEDTDKPCDITTTTSTQVAVTVPYRGHIQFISVSNKLSKSHTIQTDGECNGICCHQDKLIVTYCNPGKLEILDMKGRVITTVTTDSTGQDVFSCPEYVQANSSSIYVSDVDEVIMLNWTGEITGRITDIENPMGIALLGDGRLLVCDYAGDRVYQVSERRNSSRIVLQDVSEPNTVCVDDRRHRLYISRCTDDDKPGNNILVYNI